MLLEGAVYNVLHTVPKHIHAAEESLAAPTHHCGLCWASCRTLAGSVQVVVANDGTIFVADGYCNSRVVRYSAEGNFEAEYKLPRGAMDTPHSLVLHECSNALLVADRERSQVHRFAISNQELQGEGSAVAHVFATHAGPSSDASRVVGCSAQAEASARAQLLFLASQHCLALPVQAILYTLPCVQ